MSTYRVVELRDGETFTATSNATVQVLARELRPLREGTGLERVHVLLVREDEEDWDDAEQARP